MKPTMTPVRKPIPAEMKKIRMIDPGDVFSYKKIIPSVVPLLTCEQYKAVNKELNRACNPNTAGG